MTSEMKGRPKKKVPTELIIKRFDNGADEVWVWHGNSSKGFWMNQKEAQSLEAAGTNLKQRKLKDLKINAKPTDFDFDVQN